MNNIFVIYVPTHLRIENMKMFDFNNPGCERGVIKSSNECYVFVNYFRNGVLQQTAQATDPNDLFYSDGTPLLDTNEMFEVFDKIIKI